MVGDVTSAADNARAVDVALTRFGRLDSFVANAGMFDYGAGLVDTPVESLERAFDELFAVNVKGYLLGAKAAAPALIESRGSLLMTASMSSTHAGVGGVVYTASKHAVVGLVRQLAFELAPAVRVNGVAPGFMAHRHPRPAGARVREPDTVVRCPGWRRSPRPPHRSASSRVRRTTPATTCSSPRGRTPAPPPAWSSPATAASTCAAWACRAAPDPRFPH